MPGGYRRWLQRREAAIADNDNWAAWEAAHASGAVLSSDDLKRLGGLADAQADRDWHAQGTSRAGESGIAHTIGFFDFLLTHGHFADEAAPGFVPSEDTEALLQTVGFGVQNDSKP